MKKLFLLILLAIPFSTSKAQYIGGNGLLVIAPASDFADIYGAGVAFTGRIEINKIPKIKPFIETGYVSWASADEDIDTEYNSIMLGGGARLSLLGPLYVKGTIGYQLLDVEEMYYGPGVGIRLSKFDISATTNLQSDTPFLGVELSFYWAN